MAINTNIVDSIIAGLGSMPKKSEIDTTTNNIDKIVGEDNNEPGLMSIDDKRELDKVSKILKDIDADNPVFYTLPVASKDKLGGVKTISNVPPSDITEENCYVATPIKDGVPYYRYTTYSLPTASETELGGVKIGDNISISSDGVISVPDISASNITGILPVSKGGTGASNIASARLNLKTSCFVIAGNNTSNIASNSGYYKLFSVPSTASCYYMIRLLISPVSSYRFEEFTVDIELSTSSTSKNDPKAYITSIKAYHKEILENLYIVYNGSRSDEEFYFWYRNASAYSSIRVTILQCVYSKDTIYDGIQNIKLNTTDPNTPVDTIPTSTPNVVSFSDVISTKLATTTMDGYMSKEDKGKIDDTAKALDAHIKNPDMPHTLASLKLDKVENKSSADIRSELTETDVTRALKYTPLSSVVFTQSLKSGIKVGTLSVDKTDVDLYAPEDTHYTTKLIVGASKTASANAAATNDNVYLNIFDNSTLRNSHKIVGSNGVNVTSSVASDGSGVITITGTTYSTRPNPHDLIIQGNESELARYNGASEVTAIITPAKIGALPITGGTITGDLTVTGSTTIGSVLTMNDSKYTRNVLCLYDDEDNHNYGSELCIESNGNLFIGGGESANGLREAFKSGLINGDAYGADGEQMYLTSDGNIFFYSNMQTPANRRGIIYDNTGILRPLVTNTRQLGSSSYYWNKAYITEIYGTLKGKATSADKVNKSLTIQANGTGVVVFDGSADKTVNITPGTGLEISSTTDGNITINHSNSVTAGTAKGDPDTPLTFGGTFKIPTVTYDDQGHITGTGTTTMTMPSNPNVDTKATQTNTTASADYRLALSYNANDTTETQTLRKSGNFLANPATGEFYAKGYRRINITGQTLDINTLNLSAGSPMIMRYIETTSGGAANITNIPVTGQPFILDVELIRWGSATDYITKQTFISIGDKYVEYIRYCTSGSWDAWKKRIFTDTYMTQTLTTTNAAYPLLLAPSGQTATKTTSSYFGTGITFNPSTNTLSTTTFSGALSGNATSATKLTTSAGSATQPVYFSGGKPVATTYTLGKSVPSDAEFTDTVYSHPTHTAQTSGLYKITVDELGHVSAVSSVVKEDITALGIPASDTNTHYTSKNVVGSSTATANTTTALTNGNVYINSVENGAVTSTHKISGSGMSTVETDNKGNIIVKTTHPTSAGNKHIPSGGTNGDTLMYSASGTAVWHNDYVVGTQTASTNAFTGTLSGVSALYDGLSIRYYLPYAGTTSAATLKLTLSASGTTTAAIPIYRNNGSTFTNQCGAGSILYLTYRTATNRWTMSAQYDYDTFDRLRHSGNIKCNADNAIVTNDIIVAKDGVYYPLKTGTAFNITQPILFSNVNIAVNATSSQVCYSYPAYVTTTQSITLTAYKPLFIKGTLSGNIFTPISSTPLTQTIPTSDDGYQYILLGNAYDSTHFHMMPEHPIFAFKGGSFGQISGKEITDLSVSGKTITYTRGDGTTGTITTKDTVTTVTTSGSGNAVTAITASNGALTVTKGSKFLTAHPTISKSTNTTSTVYPAVGKSFTVIDSVTQDTNGHITKVNTKTVTLPTGYATCATPRDIADKDVVLENFTLVNGAMIIVYFTGTDTTNPSSGSGSGSLRLNVNNTGAKEIRYVRNGNNASMSYDYSWAFCNNNAHTFIYTGVFWRCMDWDKDEYVQQQLSTTNNDYRLLLSTDPNNDVSIGAVNKSGNFTANPATGTLNSTKISVAEKVTLQYNSTEQCLNFVFS